MKRHSCAVTVISLPEWEFSYNWFLFQHVRLYLYHPFVMEQGPEVVGITSSLSSSKALLYVRQCIVHSPAILVKPISVRLNELGHTDCALLPTSIPKLCSQCICKSSYEYRYRGSKFGVQAGGLIEKSLCLEQFVTPNNT